MTFRVTGNRIFLGLRNLYPLPIINSRRMRWVGRVAHIELKWDAYMAFVGKPKERDQ